LRNTLCSNKLMVILLVSAYMLDVGLLLVNMSWIYVWCVICSCMSLRMFTSSGEIWILCIQWFRIFIFQWWDLNTLYSIDMIFLLHHEVTTCCCWWWYRVHVGVVSRRVVRSCMSPTCLCDWWCWCLWYDGWIVLLW